MGMGVVPAPSTKSGAKKGREEIQHKESWVRETQEGCGGFRGENPRVFPKAGPIFQQPFSLPENAQTLAAIAFAAAGNR